MAATEVAEPEDAISSIGSIADKVAVADNGAATTKPEKTEPVAEPAEIQAGKKESEEKQPPAEGDTSASKGAAKPELQIPKSRFDEVSKKAQELEQTVNQWKPIVDRLQGIAQRFGKNSPQYLDALDAYYKQQSEKPRSVEEQLQEIQQWRAQQDQQRVIDRETVIINQELSDIRNSSKYEALKADWPEWQEWILGKVARNPQAKMSEFADKAINMLDSYTSNWAKRKTEEGKRGRFEGAGGGAPAVRKGLEIKNLKDFGKVIEAASNALSKRSAE